jgi:hypothetical protein
MALEMRAHCLDAGRGVLLELDPVTVGHWGLGTGDVADLGRRSFNQVGYVTALIAAGLEELCRSRRGVVGWSGYVAALPI